VAYFLGRPPNFFGGIVDLKNKEEIIDREGGRALGVQILKKPKYS
jgi:hypothetical protein